MARVAIYEDRSNRRAQMLCAAMRAGIERIGGDVVSLRPESQYREPDSDIAVFYGLAGNLARVFREYPERGLKAVYIDLGYWGRHDGGRRAGYHKIIVNGRHPTSYFRARAHLNDRFARFGIAPQSWQTGRRIVIAGMSAKAAHAEGFPAEEWEQRAIARLKQVTDRTLVYRPKPNWPGARPLPGAGYSHPKETLEAALADCHAVVTHHSNVAIDGLMAGIPTFSWIGVAAPMSLQDFSRIEMPLHPDDRAQWAADVAYCQWNVKEMTKGSPWRHLKDEGLIPS